MIILSWSVLAPFLIIERSHSDVVRELAADQYSSEETGPGMNPTRLSLTTVVVVVVDNVCCYFKQIRKAQFVRFAIDGTALRRTAITPQNIIGISCGDAGL